MTAYFKNEKNIKDTVIKGALLIYFVQNIHKRYFEWAENETTVEHNVLPQLPPIKN